MDGSSFIEWHHSYYPRTLELHNYVPNTRSTIHLLFTAGLIMSAVVLVSLALISTKQRSPGQRARFVWFTVSATLHLGFESYWIYHGNAVAGRSDLLSELWKEYAHGDSRYLSIDPVLFAVESITVTVWGPLCVLAAMSIWRDSPTQYIWQLMASMAHLFSCTLYFVLDFPTGFENCDPHPLYFWVYFVAFNSPWIAVPAKLVYDSFQTLSTSMSVIKTKIE